MFSPTLAPLNTSVSVPVLAFDDVAAIARVPDEGVVAVAEDRRRRCPGRRSPMSLPSPPISVSAPWLPVMVSLPAPPSMTRLMDAGRQGPRIDSVVAVAGVDRQHVVGAFRAGDVNLRRQSADRHRNRQHR